MMKPIKLEPMALAKELKIEEIIDRFYVRYFKETFPVGVDKLRSAEWKCDQGLFTTFHKEILGSATSLDFDTLVALNVTVFHGHTVGASIISILDHGTVEDPQLTFLDCNMPTDQPVEVRILGMTIPEEGEVERSKNLIQIVKLLPSKTMIVEEPDIPITKDEWLKAYTNE